MSSVEKWVDGFGIYGNYLHYALVSFLVGIAMIIFIYLWYKGRLDMDEEAKIQMMESNENPENKYE